MKVMLDTNVLISSIFFSSPQTEQPVRSITEHKILICDYVVEELRLVVERKFPSHKAALERFLMELPFDLVHTPKDMDFAEFPSVRDQKDSPILATAIMESASVLLRSHSGLFGNLPIRFRISPQSG